MNNNATIEVQFDPEDLVTQGDATSLIDELHEVGTEAEVTSLHTGIQAVEGMVLVALIALIAPTAAGIAVTAAFIYRVFQKGVVVDLTGKSPQIRKNPKLPRGTLLIIKHDGSSELKQGISDNKIGTAIRDILQRRPSDDKPQ
jgi:hypothetical protein